MADLFLERKALPKEILMTQGGRHEHEKETKKEKKWWYIFTYRH